MAKNVPLKFQFQDQIMILTLVSHGHAIRGRSKTTFTRVLKCWLFVNVHKVENVNAEG